MGRLKISDDNKSKAYTMSLSPKHIDMLEYLTKVLKKQRSALMQSLIEVEYKKQGGK